MQNRAARIVTGRPYEVRSNDVLRIKLTIIKGKDIPKSLFMYKVRINIYPEGITNMFELSNNGNYELRSLFK